MNTTTKRLKIMLGFAVLVLWLQPVNAQAQTCVKDTSGNKVFDLSNTQAAVAPDDVNNPGPKFNARKDAAVNFAVACETFPPALDTSCLHNYGEDYQVGLFARLASGNATLQQQAIESLRNIRREDFGAMGTDPTKVCEFSSLLADLVNFLSTDAARRGDGDSAMIGFINVLFKYKQLLQNAGVYDHVLSLIDSSPGLGGVETFSFGLRTGVAAMPGSCD